MKDYACERLYRDARILTIYEGTSQLQVVAAIRHVTTGTYLKRIREYEAMPCAEAFAPLRQRLAGMTALYEQAVARVTELKNGEYLDFCARRLVEMAGHILMGHLLVLDASRDDMFARSAAVYLNHGEAEVRKHAAFLEHIRPEDVELYKA